jgi:hypothetical protein
MKAFNKAMWRGHEFTGKDNERCRYCRIGIYQMFTDREDAYNLIACLEKQIDQINTLLADHRIWTKDGHDLNSHSR